MADVVFLALLIVHVGSIVVWMGAGVLFLSVISPSLRKMSPPARGEFMASIMPAYMRLIAASSITAIIAGLVLYIYIKFDATSLAPSSSGEILVQAGMGLTLIAVIVFFALSMPASRKLGALLKQTDAAPGGDTSSKITTLQAKLTMGARLGIALLTLTLILMLIGANV